MAKREYSLFLDVKLVTKLDKMIFPYKRSNVIHELISEFLVKKLEEKKGFEAHKPQSQKRPPKQPSKGSFS